MRRGKHKKKKKRRRRARNYVPKEVQEGDQVKRSKHHIIPKSRGGDSSPENIILIDDRLHKILHAIFNNLTPDEYLPYANDNLIKVCIRAVRAIVKYVGKDILDFDDD